MTMLPTAPDFLLNITNLLDALPEEHDIILDQPPPLLPHRRRDEREEREAVRHDMIRERGARGDAYRRRRKRRGRARVE